MVRNAHGDSDTALRHGARAVHGEDCLSLRTCGEAAGTADVNHDTLSVQNHRHDCRLARHAPDDIGRELDTG
jgi:hypothetical protein